MAAGSLARFTGPPTVLEGKYGFLNVSAPPDHSTADRGLARCWQTLTVAHKRTPATAPRSPMTAALALKPSTVRR
jgi:hypothetical protein